MLTAVGYGFFMPFFVVVSGVNFDLAALTEDPLRLLELPLFLGLFFVDRGVPALLLYRRHLDRQARLALAVFSSTELPLVVAITTIAIDQGHMRASTAASLIGAAILSTMLFPLAGCGSGPPSHRSLPRQAASCPLPRWRRPTRPSRCCSAR